MRLLTLLQSILLEGTAISDETWRGCAPTIERVSLVVRRLPDLHQLTQCSPDVSLTNMPKLKSLSIDLRRSANMTEHLQLLQLVQPLSLQLDYLHLTGFHFHVRPISIPFIEQILSSMNTTITVESFRRGKSVSRDEQQIEN